MDARAGPGWRGVGRAGHFVAAEQHGRVHKTGQRKKKFAGIDIYFKVEGLRKRGRARSAGSQVNVRNSPYLHRKNNNA